MGKEKYWVYQPAEVYYRAEVMANSAEEAEAMTHHPSFDGALWELALDTVEMVDKPGVVEVVEEVND
jgi:hypothetical protein